SEHVAFGQAAALRSHRPGRAGGRHRDGGPRGRPPRAVPVHVPRPADVLRPAHLPAWVRAAVYRGVGHPLPAPGDVFVMYVGVHIPRNIAAWLVAWLGLIFVVVLGATNLFFVSRRFGTRLVHSRFAEYVHLNPERLAKAEGWFKRYGVLAIIFGRHIPGFRVPITVASGIFNVPYRVFAPSVAVSTAIWAGVMLTLGML